MKQIFDRVEVFRSGALKATSDKSRHLSKLYVISIAGVQFLLNDSGHFRVLGPTDG